MSYLQYTSLPSNMDMVKDGKEVEECLERVQKLRKAAMTDDVETLRYTKEDLYTKFGGWSLLHTAAWSGAKEVAGFLLDVGLDPGERDLGGSMPMHLAVRRGHLGIVERLVEAGASVNEPGHSGSTPLHLAARRGHTDVFEYLLARGADLSSSDGRGRTSLDWAEVCGHRKIADLIKLKMSA